MQPVTETVKNLLFMFDKSSTFSSIAYPSFFQRILDVLNNVVCRFSWNDFAQSFQPNRGIITNQPVSLLQSLSPIALKITDIFTYIIYNIT